VSSFEGPFRRRTGTSAGLSGRHSVVLRVRMMLPASVVVRPLQGEPPTIDLVMGYSRSNTSALLKRFVSRAEELVAGVMQKSGADGLWVQ